MQVGDVVVRKSYNKDITFKIVDLQETENGNVYILKGINLRILADSLIDDLELVSKDNGGETDKVFDRKVNTSIKRVLANRLNINKRYRSPIVDKSKESKNKEGGFGRPGKVLHIDADSEYMNKCLKVYKQLSIEAVGSAIPEKDQSSSVLELIKSIRPDIVVITGHDGMIKGAKDYLDLANYKNSKHFVDTVAEIRTYQPNYDDLVIFAGACQSCYEAILDAGANFASSPNRVLIHCLDPVFVCEKIAYTNFEKIVPIQEVIENTITGLKGIGGLQTRGKYREGFPKSLYA
ncbi:MAG: sporulation peptidase YabG [Clostridiaceae bacterium]|nr:sporulation peptidase YabG [Clostridiaceae bacterium]